MTEVDPQTLEQQLGNDLVRRLSRVSPNIRQDYETDTINQYSDKLKWSGYDKETRKRVIEMGLSAFKEKLRRGGNTIHRSAEESDEKRILKQQSI